MPQNISCLLALALAVGSALVAIPSQAQTATETNENKTVFSQSSISDESTESNLKKSKAVNQNNDTKISQAKPAEKPARERNWVYSRIGFGLKQ